MFSHSRFGKCRAEFGAELGRQSASICFVESCCCCSSSSCCLLLKEESGGLSCRFLFFALGGDVFCVSALL